MQTSTNVSSQTSSTTKYYPDERQHIELFLCCRDLKLPSSSSLNCISISMFIQRDGIYEQIARTEKQTKNLANPNFKKSFHIEYFFSINQNLKFVIKTSDPHNFSEKSIAEIETTLSVILNAPDSTNIFDLTRASNKGFDLLGKLIIRSEKIVYTANLLKVTFKASDLKFPKKLFAKTSYNLTIRLFRPLVDGSFSLIYESEIRKTVSPRWSDLEFAVQTFCNGDLDKRIKLQVLNHVSFSVFEIIGEGFFTVNNLLSAGDLDYEISLMNPKDNKPTGLMTIDHVTLIEKPHFLDYIRSGLHFNLLLGIDYTSSNGDPWTLESLHSLKTEGGNEYQRAIRGVFDVLLNYSHTKKVDMYGFGGIPQFPECKSALTHHCFPLTGNFNEPHALGLEGIMQIYKDSLKFVRLASPSYLEPVIQQARKVAKKTKKYHLNEYTVLLILTDGKCHDMQDTINAIISSTSLPLSVIIIGVGDGDFKKMEILDGDKGLLNHDGKKAARDMVQFVNFRKFQNNPDLLAKYVLEEIPEQVVEFMLARGIMPRMKSGIPDEHFDETLIEDDDLCTEQKNESLYKWNTQHGAVDVHGFPALDLFKMASVGSNSQRDPQESEDRKDLIHKGWRDPTISLCEIQEDEDCYVNNKNESLSRFSTYHELANNLAFKKLDNVKIGHGSSKSHRGDLLSAERSISPNNGNNHLLTGSMSRFSQSRSLYSSK